MNTETMTVHQALSELKVLDARIRKESDEIVFVTTNRHSNTKINGKEVAQFCDEVKNRYKGLRTLINRRNAIKRAVTRSNAETVVNIGGTEMTVAEAIDQKNYGVVYLARILQRIERDHTTATVFAEQKNGDALDQRADMYIRSLYENADMKNLSDEVRKVREDYIRSQTIDVIDPIRATDRMQELRDAIDRFAVNVDSALSVSNALTAIEVTYETM